jgi:Ankyrin repeats (3 copies)
MRTRLVIALLTSLSIVTCTRSSLKNIVGNWYVDDVGPGKPAPHLYWMAGGKRVVIDRQIASYLWAGCLIYETSRPTYSRVLFGVLPGKTPAAIAGSDAFHPFRMTIEGVRRFEIPKDDVNGGTTLAMEFVASSDICNLAYAQPPFTEDWAEKTPLDFTRVKSERYTYDVNGADSVGNSTLNLEIHRRHTDVVEELLAAGANVNAPNNAGVTPLMTAVGFYTDNVQILQRLLDAGADINDQDKGGKTALMYAAQYRRTEAVRFLLAYGARPLR